MGRKRKGRTTTMRVRKEDIARLKAMADGLNISVPDLITRITKRRK